MVSLAEQLLKAGLVDKNKVKLANQDKSKQKKVERRTGEQSVDEVKLAAQEAQRKQAERARELNLQRDAAANQKAIAAQITQMVKTNRQNKGNGDIAYHYTHNGKVERMYVSAAVQGHLMAGRLVIVVQNGVTELGAARGGRQDCRARPDHGGAGQQDGGGGGRRRSVRGVSDTG